MKTFFKVVGFVSLILFSMIVLLLAIIFAHMVFSCEPKKSKEESIQHVITVNSEIGNLPSDIELEYYVYAKSPSWQEADFIYAFFRLESEPTEWLQEKNFENSLEEKGRANFEGRFFSKIDFGYSSLNAEVSTEYIPDFNEVYYYLNTRTVIFAYFPQQATLIAIQSELW